MPGNLLYHKIQKPDTFLKKDATMKQRILSNWNFMRFLRLGLGLAIIVQSILEGNWAMGMVGLLFTAMPVFNIGCCATAGCATLARKSAEPLKVIKYEEVV